MSTMQVWIIIVLVLLVVLFVLRNRIKDYVKVKMKRHIYYLFGFSRKDYATFQIISFSRRKNSKTWWMNNLIFPLFIIIVPIGAIYVRDHFGTLPFFNKNAIEILISGSLTLLGLNVLRSASTSISEKLDESKVPDSLKDQLPDVLGQLQGIKSNLKSRIFFFTVAGSIVYILQVTQIIRDVRPEIYYLLILIGVISLSSIIQGRFIHLMETNFFDDSKVVELLFNKLKTSSDEYRSLEDEVNQTGL